MTLLSKSREVGEFRKRYKWMALFALLVFSVLLGRAIQMQVVDFDYWNGIATENITKTITLRATRGLIMDSKGHVIATNRPAYNLHLTPQFLDPDTDLPKLAELMGLSAAERDALRAKLESVPERRRSHQIEIFRDITREQMAALTTHQSEFRGVDVVAVPVRSYPFGALGAHALGYLNEVSAEDLETLRDQGYRAGDTVGRSGIEKAWESYLRGRRGHRRVLVDSRGRASDPSNQGELVEPVPGRDLSLTIDMDLMRIIERAFRVHPSGGAVVVDVHSGRVRALFSKPSYDLNEIAGRLTPARASEIQNDPYRPLIDKTIYGSYFPGSTFKVFSFLAALGADVTHMSDHIHCPGYYEFGGRRFRCSHVHGDVDAHYALVQSCNTFVYDLAPRVGIDRLHRYATEFGLGERTGIGINTESAGFIPTYAWYMEHYDNQFRGGFTLNESIGQGNTSVTVIQLALAYAAIANGGTLFVPQLVERVLAPDGEVIETFSPRVRRRVSVSPEHLAFIRAGLVGVVNDPKGTAYEARIEGGVPVAGKTGTAQVSQPPEGDERYGYRSRSHAWFAAFAPAENPELAIVLLVEHGGSGGNAAAPLVTQIVNEYLGEQPPEREAR